MSKKKPLRIDHSELIKIYRKALDNGVDLDQVEEKVEKLLNRGQVTKQIEKAADASKFERLKRSLPVTIRLGAFLMPALLILVGFLMVGSAVWPIIGFYLRTLPDQKARELVAPIPNSQVLDVTPLIIAQVNDLTDGGLANEAAESLGSVMTNDSGPIIIDADLDYTNLANWFEVSNLESLQHVNQFEGRSDEYVLEIPKLKVHNTLVKVGGTDLNKSLIHYPGTSLPGKPGSPVIFGHSVLRQFYNPKESNPRRYNSIFSTIMTLEKGDKIYIYYGNIKYTYMVLSKTEVKPTDTYILSQRYDSRQLKLVTCTPEGTYLRRGVVTAALIKE